MRKIDAGLSHRAAVGACFVTIRPTKTKYFDADLVVFAVKTFQKTKAIASYYGALSYSDLSFRRHTTKFY